MKFKFFRAAFVLGFFPLVFPVAGFAAKNAPNDFGIINAHEHIESLADVPKFLNAMKANGIEKTVILGSPRATFDEIEKGFSGHDENNLEILKIAKQYPDRFIPFPTLDPHDPHKLDKLKKYLAMGGKGLKLYSGHRIFHDLAIDDDGMTAVYAFCQKNQIPVLLHVNTGYYQDEFVHVLQRFPNLKIICPHFCLASIKTERLEYLMDTFPNLYTDISFGPLDYLNAGLRRIARDPEKYRRFVIKYQDRIFFGTDMAVSYNPYKTEEWLTGVARAYRDLLEKDSYAFFGMKGIALKGLHLGSEILEKIYRKNFERFFSGKSQS